MYMHSSCRASYSVTIFYRSVNWNYCILDEGHIIKNTKTKVQYDPSFMPIEQYIQSNCRNSIPDYSKLTVAWDTNFFL